MRADFLLSLILPDPQTRLWQIDDLPPFHVGRCHIVQILPTVLASLDHLQNTFIRGRRQAQAVTSMAFLPAGFLLAFASQTLWLAGASIRRGRQMASMAIFDQPFFQHLHPLQQRGNQFIPLRKMLLLCLFFCLALDHFVFWLHTCYFNPVCKFACTKKDA